MPENRVSVQKRQDERRIEQLDTLLKRYCLALTKSTWDAEDLAQDTWTKALTSNASYEGHANPEALLLRIAHNTWIDRVRRDTLLKRIMKSEREQASGETREQTATDATGNRLDVELAFRALVEHLSPLQRSVLLLRDVFGYSAAESARIVGTTEGGVKAALHRAHRALSRVKEIGIEGHVTPPLGNEMEGIVRELASSLTRGDVANVMRVLQSDAVPITDVLAEKRAKRTSERSRRPEMVLRNRRPHDRRRAGVWMDARTSDTTMAA